MIHSIRFTAVLDTNVIYPIDFRDLLLWFAFDELYTPKWSQHIFDEWRSIMLRKGVDTQEAEKRILNVQEAFPDAQVLNYEALIPALELPDHKDRHVLAAAIKTNANVIVTQNIKDFPTQYLSQFGLSAKGLDDFLTDTIDLNHETAVRSFKRLVANKYRPPLTEHQMLDRYRKLGLVDTANYLHALI